MVYKLYVVTNKIPANEAKGLSLYNEFKDIYNENEVEVIGAWENVDDPYEVYFMTGFKSEDHYASFVESMKGNDKYQELSRILENERESVKAINLRMSIDL